MLNVQCSMFSVPVLVKVTEFVLPLLVEGQGEADSSVVYGGPGAVPVPSHSPLHLVIVMVIGCITLELSAWSLSQSACHVRISVSLYVTLFLQTLFQYFNVKIFIILSQLLDFQSLFLCII